MIKILWVYKKPPWFLLLKACPSFPNHKEGMSTWNTHWHVGHKGNRLDEAVLMAGPKFADWSLPFIIDCRVLSPPFICIHFRVRRDSRLCLNFSYLSVHISRLGLVSVSENHFTEVSVLSLARKKAYKNSCLESRVFRVKFWEIHQEILVSFSISRISRSKFLVSVSENHFVEVSVLCRSRNFNQTSSRLTLMHSIWFLMKNEFALLQFLRKCLCFKERYWNVCTWVQLILKVVD